MRTDDNCFNQGQAGTPKLSYDRYKIMSDALLATKRPIHYALCNWVSRTYWVFNTARLKRSEGRGHGIRLGRDYREQLAHFWRCLGELRQTRWQMPLSGGLHLQD